MGLHPPSDGSSFSASSSFALMNAAAVLHLAAPLGNCSHMMILAGVLIWNTTHWSHMSVAIASVCRQECNMARS